MNMKEIPLYTYLHQILWPTADVCVDLKLPVDEYAHFNRLSDGELSREHEGGGSL